VSKEFVILVSWRFIVAASSKEHIEALNEKKKMCTTHEHSLWDVPLCGWLDEYQRFGTT